MSKALSSVNRRISAARMRGSSGRAVIGLAAMSSMAGSGNTRRGVMPAARAISAQNAT